MRFFRFITVAAALTVIVLTLSASSCGDSLGSPVEPVRPVWTSPEQFCASLPKANGNLFWCGYNISGLQMGLPNGWQGGCMPAQFPGLGLVGYSGYGYAPNGKAFGLTVETLAQEDAICYPSGQPRLCSGIMTCSRQ